MQGALGTGLRPNLYSQPGLAPFGMRHGGGGVKGLGYFGAVPHAQGGYSTEISTEFDHNGKAVEAPLMVPTLSAQELNMLLKGVEPTEQVYEKAMAHALMRMQQGLSPFAGPTDLRMPMPR
jgi:hypothetical protein